jgi:KDO2-lipid IV(A) lauroyltransferase
MLVDQYYVRGVEVTFFGRRTMANPLIARLAQHFNCPIHGTRVIRLAGNRLRAELSDEITPVRDEFGKVDIAATMQVITNVIEGWIREHPEQWLWLHRRWRPQDRK